MNRVVNNEEKIKILFIGNSYTYYNDMPKIFEEIAKGQGVNVEVTSVTKGGYTLCQLADTNDEYGKKADEALKREKFDVVVLQEQSCRPVKNAELFEKGAKALHEKIKENGAVTVLYQTWGRKDGNADLCTIAENTGEMAKMLEKAYEKLADILSCRVSKVGSAFLDVYENHPEIELYAPDGSHPNTIGSCLAALCHYSFVFGEDPENVKLECMKDENTARILKDAVRKIMNII